MLISGALLLLCYSRYRSYVRPLSLELSDTKVYEPQETSPPQRQDAQVNIVGLTTQVSVHYPIELVTVPLHIRAVTRPAP